MNKCNGFEREFGSAERYFIFERQFNLHIRSPYRVIKQMYSFDGLLDHVKIHVCDKGFRPLKIKLVDGFMYHVAKNWERVPFDKQVFGPNELGNEIRNNQWGRILDEEGFARIRKELEMAKAKQGKA